MTLTDTLYQSLISNQVMRSLSFFAIISGIFLLAVGFDLRINGIVQLVIEFFVDTAGCFLLYVGLISFVKNTIQIMKDEKERNNER